MKTKGNIVIKIVIYVLVLVVVFSSGFLYGQYETAKQITTGNSNSFIDKVVRHFVGPSLTSDDWQLLDTIRDIINDKYYKPNAVTATLLNIGAAHGMVNALPDPYSAYLDPEEYKEFLQSTAGNYSGIGVLVKEAKDRKGILIVKVFPGSPAEKVGLKNGDIIVKVGKEDIRGLPIEAVTPKIKGPTGTKVHLTVLRGEETLEFDVERQTIHIPAVLNDRWLNIKGHKVAYIDFSTMFFRGSAKDVANILKYYQDQGAEAIILDIRNNPGGLVTEVVDLLGYFVPGKHVLTIQERSRKEELNAQRHQWVVSVPVVLLINGFSASASEIFSANLKYYKKAVLIGTRTYGKGTVQELEPLGEAGALKLTIAEYITAGGYHVDGKGVEPDIIVSATTSNTATDVILQRAEEYLTETLGN